jgi:hypothetical protein
MPKTIGLTPLFICLGLIGLFPKPSMFGAVLALEPGAQSVQAGEKDALGDIGLIELVP